MPKPILVTQRTLKGFQDHLPQEAIARVNVIERIRRVYESYGYSPFDTPILEHLETLIGAGSEETNKQMFRLETPEGDAVAMRFDLTVPFARLLAQYPEQLKPPVRRYHIGPVFRADKPDPGRYRQFTQCDIDAAGSTSTALDAEVIAVMAEVLKTLGVKEFSILINNRKLIDALLGACGIEDAATHKHILRVIDKLPKIGEAAVIKELGPGRVDESGDPIKGVGLEDAVIAKLIAFVSLKADSRSSMLEKMLAQLPDDAADQAATDQGAATVKQSSSASQASAGAKPIAGAKQALASEMKELADALDGLGIAEEHAVFDPSLARGLDYYTGPVFEIILPQARE
ncbi:MAG: HisS family protein, partial [Candidatus Sumerlaeota bacterium]|nr:HisS family protein [Candidatus Sumerlaeota bacterium]